MEQQKVEMWIAQNSKMLPASKLPILRDMLAKLPDEKFVYLQSVEYKDPTTLLIISILIGSMGIDRFMLGQAGMGVLKLLTAGGCGIWWIVDMINIQDMTKEANYKALCDALAIQGINIY